MLFIHPKNANCLIQIICVIFKFNILSLNLCRLCFFGFTNFLDCKVFATKKLVAARYGSNKNGICTLAFLDPKLRKIIHLSAFCMYVHFMQRPLNYYHLQSALKTAIPGSRDPNIIFTQNLGQDLFELIYHLIKGNVKFSSGVWSKSFQG